MNFGQVVELVKAGGRAARAGWNGKEMFIFLVNGSRFTVNREPLLSILGEGTAVDYRGHIDMRTADGSIVPWVASQTDILADDWTAIGDNPLELAAARRVDRNLANPGKLVQLYVNDVEILLRLAQRKARGEATDESEFEDAVAVLETALADSDDSEDFRPPWEQGVDDPAVPCETATTDDATADRVGDFITRSILLPDKPVREGFARYVGIKVVDAQPMTKADYCQLRGWDVPANDDPEEVGYFVEYTDGGEPNVEGFDGYVSWRPADVFDRANSLVGEAPFASPPAPPQPADAE